MSETGDSPLNGNPSEAEAATYHGESAGQGLIDLRRFPAEGFASIRCGGTEVLLDYSLLHHVAVHVDGQSPAFADLARLQRALYSVTCEASQGGKPA